MDRIKLSKDWPTESVGLISSNAKEENLEQAQEMALKIREMFAPYLARIKYLKTKHHSISDFIWYELGITDPKLIKMIAAVVT